MKEERFVCINGKEIGIHNGCRTEEAGSVLLILNHFILDIIWFPSDRLCGLVFRVPGYRSRGPGPIPGATSFPEK
jgi:hypothetical protein